MSVLTKALVAWLLVSLLAIASLGFIARQQAASAAQVREQNKTLAEALNRAQEARKRDAATLLAWQKERASTGRKLAQAQEGLSQALQREKTWSEALVPPEVRSALEGPSTEVGK